MELNQEIINNVLCCPVCKGDLKVVAADKWECVVCKQDYAVHEQIIALMPPASKEQQNEITLRERIATKCSSLDTKELMNYLSREYCVPVMCKKAREFRKQFDSSQWIVDVGCGWGYCWQGTVGGKIILMDFSFNNLVIAKKLLEKEKNNILFIQADAACLPIKDKSLSGIWSVQVILHFPDTIMNGFLTEIKRVLKDKFLLEIYNANPAWLYKVICRLLGRNYHVKGKLKDMELFVNRYNARELLFLFNGSLRKGAKVTIGYNELFFHPKLGMKPSKQWYVIIENILNKISFLSRTISRQIHIRIDKRT